MEKNGSILDSVGNTPLVKLKRITNHSIDNSIPGIELFAKLEFMNPMGSIKDRTAKYMIEKAEREGRLCPGQTLIENSSGNTALGLAMVANQKGYKLKVVVRDSISREKYDQLASLGAEIIMVDHTLPPESPDSYNNITPRIVAETENAFFPDQHNNRDNNEAHYLTTGPEIWEQMEGRIDYFIAGMGTGGTVGGVAQYLKERDPKITVIGIDSEGSVFTDYFYSGKVGEAKPYLVEGLGDEFLIESADFNNVDEMIQVSDKDAFFTARKLAKIEGIMAGGSSGAALWGALDRISQLTEAARIVTIFPDSGSRYLSTIFNDKWMDRHFPPEELYSVIA